jgi:phage gp37-like protein
MRFTLIVCDRSLRDKQEARRGGQNNPGSYALLDAIRDRLFGQRLSLEIAPLSLKSQEAVFFGKNIAIYGAEYQTQQFLLYAIT